MATRIVVSKSSPVMVKPSSEPTPTSGAGAIKLSSLDKNYIGLMTTSLLMFEHPIHGGDGDAPAETIKRALSQALVHYSPISGRFVAAAGDDDGEVYIQCNGAGVAFVAASANCSLREAGLFHDGSPGARPAATALLDELAAVAIPSTSIDELAVDPTGGGDALLMMQVTEFTCGGFVLGVTWNHGVADAAGMAQLLCAVGELARGLPSPSVVPARRGDSLPTSCPPSMLAAGRLFRSFEPMAFARLAIAIPSSLIDRIRAESSAHSPGGRPCTVFEAVAAVLWRCRTRATMSSPDDPALLSFLVNLRELVGAEDGYYGNCIAAQVVTAASGAVASADVVDLAKMIGRAKERILDQFEKEKKKKDGRSDDDDDRRPPPPVEPTRDRQELARLQYSRLVLSPWRNLGFDKADFGGGTAARVMYHGQPMQRSPLCYITPSCHGGDGGCHCQHVCSVCVREEHVDAFIGELARFM
ncbi:hypothetical protein ACP4OV_023021 [Aristida adscensionis]